MISPVNQFTTPENNIPNLLRINDKLIHYDKNVQHITYDGITWYDTTIAALNNVYSIIQDDNNQLFGVDKDNVIKISPQTFQTITFQPHDFYNAHEVIELGYHNNIIYIPINSPYYHLAAFYTSAPTSINDKKPNLYNLTVYPVPSHEIINITTQDNDTLQWKIYSLTGKIMFSGFVNGSTKINTSLLPNGVYLISFNGEKGTLMKKVIIHH